MERVNPYFKDRTKNFDNYYPCVKNECNLFHVHNWIQFFVSMYNVNPDIVRAQGLRFRIIAGFGNIIDKVL